MSGNQVTVNDNTDVLVDGNGCTMDVCTNGMPSNPPLAQGAPCNESGGTRCNGSATAPACVQCNVKADCGNDSACQMFSCSSAGQCATNNVQAGTAVANQTPGDCKKNVCNGTGSVVQAIDNTDVFVDGNSCTDDLCTGGVPSNPSKAQNAPCNQGGGTRCNGSLTMPACVQCNQPIDCGSDTACKTFMCSGTGQCGSTNTADGTVVGDPTVGDCHKNKCMTGNIVNGVDDTDLPVDGKPCTNDVCTNGTPSNPNVNAGTNCGSSGGQPLMCDGSGNCVGCLSETDCPLPPNACQVRVCVAGACGFTNVADGTPVPANDPVGDCHKDICMSGAVQTVVDNTDVPVDNNPCTQDLCTNGVKSNPPVGSGVACSVGTGTECDGNGNCVECITATECTGSDTACQTRTCNGGVCGIDFKPDGTATMNQVSGDCQKNVCDGSGGAHDVADDTDVPAMTNQCATPMCSGGVPMSTNAAHGTACSQSDGRTCDGSGTCMLSFDVVRVGDGTTAPSSAATATFVEERLVSTGALVSPMGNPIALPTADSAPTSTHAFALAGAISTSGATSEGELQLSQDGKFVVLAGYNRAVGVTGNVTGTTAAAVNRLVARVDGAGAVDTSTLFGGTAFNQNNVRGATTIDGTSFWGSGAGGTTAGIWFVNKGAPTQTQVFATATRWVGIFLSPTTANQLQLYGTGSNSPLTNVWTVGTGLPTTTGQTPMTLNGMPTTLSPHGFVLFDRDGNGTVETLYVADDSTVANGGGIQKWTLSGGTWMKGITMLDPGAVPVGFRGLLGTVTGTTGTDITLVAVTSEPVANRIVKFVDTGSGTPTGTLISTAGANTAYRGVALAPQR